MPILFSSEKNSLLIRKQFIWFVWHLCTVQRKQRRQTNASGRKINIYFIDILHTYLPPDKNSRHFKKKYSKKWLE